MVTLNFENYRYLVDDGLYFFAFASSIRIAAISILLALLIGYPMALFIARSGPRMRMILLMLVVLPFWTSFLLRVYAWIGILRRTGVINNVLQSLGIIDQPLVMLQTEFAVYLGIVYTYLPLMILPLYANLTRQDRTLLEAASDFGARSLTTFLTVTLPLSLPGIVAGCMLVFIPAIGEFIIPELLGGGAEHTDDRQGSVGRVLQQPRLAGRVGRGHRIARHCRVAGHAPSPRPCLRERGIERCAEASFCRS